MYFTNAVLAVLSVNAMLAIAAPVVDSNIQQVSKRGAASVFMCSSPRGAGNCQSQSIPTEACTALSLSGNKGTIRNDQPDQFNCQWFLSSDCTGSSYGNQDDEDLTDGNGDFASMQSALCK